MSNTYQDDDRGASIRRSPDQRYTLAEFTARVKFEADSATRNGPTIETLAVFLKDHYTDQMLINILGCIKRNGYMYWPTAMEDFHIPVDVAAPIVKAEAQRRGWCIE